MLWQTDPTSLLQLSIDLWKTITPRMFLIYIAQCTYTHGRLTPPLPPIKHRSLENHYTKYVSYIAQCIYTHGRFTPSPWSIEHRLLEYHYTKLGRSTGRCNLPCQLSIDALNTATPNLADLLADLDIYI